MLPTTDQTMTNSLFTPTRVGRLAPQHRLAMAPMTRDRSAPGGEKVAETVDDFRRAAAVAISA